MNTKSNIKTNNDHINFLVFVLENILLCLLLMKVVNTDTYFLDNREKDLQRTKEAIIANYGLRWGPKKANTDSP